MTTVYLFRDADGQPVYAGCTVGLATRIREHSRKPWWSDVVSTEMWEHADHDEALCHKADLIYATRPRMNKHHNTGRRRLGRAASVFGWCRRPCAPNPLIKCRKSQNRCPSD